MYSATRFILALVSVISGAAAIALRDGGDPIFIDSYEPTSAIQYRDLIDTTQPETFNNTKMSGEEYEDLEDFDEVDIKAIIKGGILGRREPLTSQKLKFLENPLANSGNFEGDIILPPSRGSKTMREWGNSEKSDFERNFNRPNLWTNGVVPYLISSHYGTYGRKVIFAAMQEFHSYTCIQLVPRIDHRHFIIIKPKQGCASHIGRRGGGQYLSLVDGCLEKKTIIHEIMHTLGFVHRPFKNDATSRLMSHVSDLNSRMEALEIEQPVEDFDHPPGLPLHDRPKRSVSKNDLASSMEYRSVSSGTNFGKGGFTTHTFGNRNGLSSADAMSINKMYGCPQQHPWESIINPDLNHHFSILVPDKINSF